MRHLHGLRPACPKCGHGKVLKSGRVPGKRRFQCAACGYLFTRIPPAFETWRLKAISLGLCACGISSRKVAELVNLPEKKTQSYLCELCGKYFLPENDYDVVKMPLKHLASLLQDPGANHDGGVVIVPMDENSGGMAGMIRFSNSHKHKA